MKVKLLKNLDTVPTSLLNLPKTCRGIVRANGEIVVPCGADYEISEEFDSLYCSNKNCPCTLLNKLKSIAEDFGLYTENEEENSIVEQADLVNFIQEYGIENHMQLFMYEVQDGTFSEFLTVEESQKIYDIIQSFKNMSLVEYLKTFRIKSIRGMEDMFLNVNTLEELYFNIDEGGIEYIENLLAVYSLNLHNAEIRESANKLYNSVVSGDFSGLQSFAVEMGISNILEICNNIAKGGVDYIISLKAKKSSGNSVSLQALLIYKELLEVRSELFEYKNSINLCNIAKDEKVYVAFTGFYNCRHTIERILRTLNKKYIKSKYFIYSAIVNTNTDFVVVSSVAQQTSKNYQANKYSLINNLKRIEVTSLEELNKYNFE